MNGYEQVEIEELKKERDRLKKALEFYGDPVTYHACGFLFDRPCGAFEDDFSDNEFYPYPKPGKLARNTLGYEPEWTDDQSVSQTPAKAP